MELEPQIGFWRSFDEPNQDKYISWQEDVTPRANLPNDKPKKAAVATETPARPVPCKTTTPVVKIALKPFTPKTLPCQAGLPPPRSNMEIYPVKGRPLQPRTVVPCPTANIANNAPPPKLLLRQVCGQWTPQYVSNSSNVCLICGRNFQDQRTLNAHLTRAHSPTSNPLNLTANGSTNEQWTICPRPSNNTASGNNYWLLQCGLCQMKFLHARDLHQHTVSVHGSARIIIKMALPKRLTTEKEKGAKKSGSTPWSTEPQLIMSESISTQTSSVDTARSSDSVTEIIVIEDADTTEGTPSSENNTRTSSLPSSGASRTEDVGTEKPPVENIRSSDVKETPASGISCSIPETPEKVPENVARLLPTEPPSNSRWQNEDGMPDLTPVSNLESERQRDDSSDRLGSPRPGSTHVPHNELSNNPATSGSTPSDTCSQREPSVCTVAPTTKESSSLTPSTRFPSCLSSPAARLEVPPGGPNRDEERNETVSTPTTFPTQRSPSNHPNLKRPHLDGLTDCACRSRRAGGDIASQTCIRPTMRSPISPTPPSCAAEAPACTHILDSLVSEGPVHTPIPGSNPRPSETCMHLRRYKSENQVATIAKMLLAETFELLLEINKRPLDLVKPLVNALQRLIFTMETNIFVAYMNCVLPEASWTALRDPLLQQMAAQPPFPNNRPRDALESPVEQLSSTFFAGFREASGSDKRCDGFRCQCSAKRFKGATSGVQECGVNESDDSLVPFGSHMATTSHVSPR